MIELNQNIFFLLIVLLAVAVAVLFVITLRVKGLMQQQQKEQSAIQGDLRALCNAAVQVGERVNRMEKDHKALQQRQQELGVLQSKMASSDAQEVSFDQAIKLARKGSSVEELMEICSISRGEAELIAMMHRLGSDN